MLTTTQVLQQLVANDGAILQWQVSDSAAFKAAAFDGFIKFDEAGDCFVHPHAARVAEGGWTMVISPDRVATAHAATLVAIWAAWSDEAADTLDDALRLTCEAARKLDMHQVDGVIASPLNYFVCAYLDDTNPEDLTYAEMMQGMDISVKLMTVG